MNTFTTRPFACIDDLETGLHDGSANALTPGLAAALLVASMAMAVAPALPAQSPAPIQASEAIHHPIAAANGMVASQEALATRVGVRILADGGNAVDAAVAVAFSLAVTLPRAGNIGGGGFMLVHESATGQTHALDYRERAPARATRDMYLDDDQQVDKQRKRFSHLAVGVPGTVAGLALAHERFGSLPWRRLLEPAIAFARDGIVVTRDLAASLSARAKRLARDADTAAIFLRGGRGAPGVGERLVQADLAATLELIAEHGRDGFYRGRVAAAIAREMADHGGLVDAEDLAGYQAVVRKPVTGHYRGYEIRSMPPPSSGGVHLIQILNLLEPYPLGALGHNSADTVHLMAESMKLAYADRSEHLGDPDHWSVPVRGLVSKRYADALRAGIRPRMATPSTTIKPGRPQPFESPETTHFSIMDSQGNVVSNTYTLNFSYGSGLVAAGTGVLLNNEMDDFSGKPGTMNAYGLIGGEANSVAAGKRPLSSMSPTIVLAGGQPWLATGSPGGSRIITTVAQIIMNTIDHGMNIADASHAPRVHHQWLPDELRIEPGISIDTVRALSARGHTVARKRAMGSTQSVMRLEHGLEGSSDPRRRGALTAGF